MESMGVMSRGARVPLPALPPAGYHLGKSLFPPPDLSFPISKMKLLHLKSQKSLPTRVFSNLTWECSNGRVILMAWLLGFLRFGGSCWEEGSNIRGPPPLSFMPSLMLYLRPWDSPFLRALQNSLSHRSLHPSRGSRHS